MERLAITPRNDWQKTVESQGLLWHSLEQPYWTENACYRFTSREIDELEKATYAVNNMALEAVQYIIDNEEVFDAFEIYDWFRPFIREAWKNEEFTIFGRFDFSYDGKGPPKLLEYNADTPTGLLEASVIQWHWLQDLKQEVGGSKADQFNSIHERLIEGWQVLRNSVEGNPTMHFTSLPQSLAVEDYVTVNYLRDTAMQGGWQTYYVPIDELGYNTEKGELRDQNDNPVKLLTKLYPYEWIAEEEIGKILTKMPPQNRPRFFEAPWKALLSNKALLVLLYEMFPKSPYLLRASYEEAFDGTYVKKPQFSREGANITVVDRGKTLVETEGEYGDTDLWVYQDFAPLPNFGGNYPVIGSWLVNGYATGIGIRESDSLVTGNLSRFVPHYFG